MNREEIQLRSSTNLFIGNKLARGEVTVADGSVRVDLRNIRSPIIVLLLLGRQHHAAAAGAGLDHSTSMRRDDDRSRHGQTIVYPCITNVGHLGIFVSGAVARKEHAGFVELLDLIEALPPGLYEMLIEDKQPGHACRADSFRDRYVTRFEQRSIADIADAVRRPRGRAPLRSRPPPLGGECGAVRATGRRRWCRLSERSHG